MPVQVMQPGPYGPRPGHVALTDIASLGSILGASGMEPTAVANLLQMVQTLAVQVVMEALPAILANLRELQAARIARLKDSVNKLPAATYQPGILARAMTQQTVVSYISLDEVLRLLDLAAAELPNVR